jgi:hypothetical protein
MNECVICGTECRGKTCSGKCRVALHRQSKSVTNDVTPCNTYVTPEGELVLADDQPESDLEHCARYGITQAMLDDLPQGVVKPRAPIPEDDQYYNQGWQASDSYAQRTYDMLTMPLEQFKSLYSFIPCWRLARG